MARRSSWRPWLPLQLVGARPITLVAAPDSARRVRSSDARCCWSDALVHSEPAGALATALNASTATGGFDGCVPRTDADVEHLITGPDPRGGHGVEAELDQS